MKAAVIHELGDENVFRYEEVPEPMPRPRQVVIQVKAASINRGDLDRRQGTYPFPAKLPLVIGWDVAGTVVAVGSQVSERHVGQRVIAAMPQGGYAEKAVASVGATVPLPDNISYEDGATLPVAFVTAWYALEKRAHLRDGEVVLIQAGAGGVGSASVQLAKSFGASVIATVSGPSQAEFVKGLGADHVVDFRKEDFRECVQRITEARGVDVAVDFVGGKTLLWCIECLALGGRLVSVGDMMLEPVMLDVSQMVVKGISLHGLQMSKERNTGPELARIVELVSKGHVSPVVDKVFPLSQVAEAHRYVARHGKMGKVLLVP